MPPPSARPLRGDLTARLTVSLITTASPPRPIGAGSACCWRAVDGAHSEPMELVCTWMTGPDAGGVQRVTWLPGPDGTTTSAVIGRAGPFRCDDDGLLPHHALVEARAVLAPRADGDEVDVAAVELWVTRLAGRDDLSTEIGRAHV